MTEGPFTKAQLAQLTDAIRAAVREELAEAGLRLDDSDHQDAAKEDFRFLRRLRIGLDGVAAKIGWAIIAAIISGMLWLVNSGLDVWRGTGK